jgi:hypothetical protein
MKFLAHSSILLTLTALSTGCAIDSGLTLAPGAEQVKITTNPADVTGCTPVGNISPDAINNLSHRLAQNQAVGLNADVVFSTGYGGVAYRCTK